MINKEKCTVLINSCDSYSDLWPVFFKLFYDYWPDCPYEIVLNTESKKFDYPPLSIKTFSLYKQGEKISYGERLIQHLDRIDSEYIIMLLDDFFLRKRVDNKDIETLIENLDNDKKIASFSFDSIDDSLNVDDGKFPHFILRPQYCEYRFNLSGAIWRKSVFRSLIRRHESPWETEMFGTYRSFGCKDKIYTIDSYQNAPINYGKTKALNWGVVRGKWAYDDVAPLFADHGISVDFSLRGCLGDETEKVSAISSKKTTIETINSFGLFLYVKMLMWSLGRKINKLMGKELKDRNYLEYLRRKHIKSV